MDVLSQELEKIQLLEIEDTEAAFQAFSKLETTLTIASDEVKREFYVQFALFMFRSTDYNKCMDLLMQAQEYGFPKENIRQFIYENFVEPNLQECRFSYEENIQRIKEKLYVCEIPKNRAKHDFQGEKAVWESGQYPERTLGADGGLSGKRYLYGERCSPISGTGSGKNL